MLSDPLHWFIIFAAFLFVRDCARGRWGRNVTFVTYMLGTLGAMFARAVFRR